MLLCKFLHIEKNSIKHGFCFVDDATEFHLFAKEQNLSVIRFKLTKLRKSSFSAENFTIPFLQNLKSMLDSKISLIDALEIVQKSFTTIPHQAAISYIICKIKNGNKIHIALQILKKIGMFNEMYLTMIKMSESIAILPNVIEVILKDIIKKNTNKKILIKELSYPILLTGTVFAVIFFWIFNVLPTFIDSFEYGNNINCFAKFFIFVRNFCIIHNVFVLILLLFLILFVVKFGKIIILRIPIIMNIFRDIKIFELSSNITLMLSAKVQFVDVLKDVSELCFHKELTNAYIMLLSGKSISQTFDCVNIFNEQEKAIISSHSKIGDLQTAFATIRDFLQTSIKMRIARILSIISPILIIFLGLLLIIIISSMLLPLYNNFI